MKSTRFWGLVDLDLPCTWPPAIRDKPDRNLASDRRIFTVMPHPGLGASPCPRILLPTFPSMAAQPTWRYISTNLEYGSDFGDWGNGTNPAAGYGNNPPQVQDAFGAPGKAPDLGANELIALDVIGYTLIAGTSIQDVSITTNAGPSGLTFSFTFTVDTMPGQTYLVQQRTSLTAGSWQDLKGIADPFVATGLYTIISDKIAATNKSQFYRIVTVPPVDSGSDNVLSKPQAIVATPEMIVTNGPIHYLRTRASR